MGLADGGLGAGMTFDVVIIGGGIIGSAAAHFLARANGGAKVAVIEPDPSYAAATTPQGAGGVRQLFSRPENVAMSRYSLAFYENFAALVGDDAYRPSIDFKKQGYLFVVGAAGAATLERNAGLQRSLGAAVEVIDVAGLRARFPSLGTDDVALGCYSPDDGWVDPFMALQGFRKSAERRGASYLKERVVALEAQGPAVRAATLASGKVVKADIFINAAGPWASEVAAMVGASLPVVPMPRAHRAAAANQG